MCDTITTPSSTATPNNAMKPMEADRFRFMPRTHSAAMPPTSASGTISRISTVWRRFRNDAYSRPLIISSDKGSAIASRASACFSFWYWPPQSRV